MRRCRVAATQVDARSGEIEHNLEIHLALIEEAATAGCDLVLFPELSVTGLRKRRPETYDELTIRS
jgi:N-carbamoylputrescine amidase